MIEARDNKKTNISIDKNKIKKFNQICKDIKEIKIQGATNIAKAAIEAFNLIPTKESKNILFKLRPTEPTLTNAINKLEFESKENVLKHFQESQDKINFIVYKLLKSNKYKKIYTHCHSTNVIKALIFSKKKGINLEVFNTETRPLFQGRKTSQDLAKANIKVTEFVDSALLEAIKESDVIFIGSDAILDNGVINKVGSSAISELGFLHKKPLYIVSDSWKFSPKNVKIEERDFKEVWKNAPKEIKIRNPAFEKIEKKYIKGIISELGILNYKDFIKKAKNNLEN